MEAGQQTHLTLFIRHKGTFSESNQSFRDCWWAPFVVATQRLMCPVLWRAWHSLYPAWCCARYHNHLLFLFLMLMSQISPWRCCFRNCLMQLSVRCNPSWKEPSFKDAFLVPCGKYVRVSRFRDFDLPSLTKQRAGWDLGHRGWHGVCWFTYQGL